MAKQSIKTSAIAGGILGAIFTTAGAGLMAHANGTSPVQAIQTWSHLIAATTAAGWYRRKCRSVRSGSRR